MSSFTKPLHVEILQLEKYGKTLASVLESFSYVSDFLDKTITVEAGFDTDFASVPRILWTVFPPLGRYAKAAVIHDWLCVNHICSSREAAVVFLEAMIILDVPAWKRELMYFSVLYFGPQFERD